MKIAKKQFPLLFMLLLTSCNPMKQLYKEINKMGYIEYRTPLEHSGTGTIIGGSPKSFSLMAPPQECFPDEIDGQATNLRFIDKTTLPSKSKKITVSADVALDILRLAETTEGTIGLGVKFNNVTTVSLEMSDATVEYFNAVKLENHYEETMSDACKQLLDVGAFVYQALRIGKLKYTFYNANGAEIKLSLNNIQEFLDIGLKLGYSIENGAKLVFEKPHYMGYQLGRMRLEDHGLGLWRSSKVLQNKWVWESLNIFIGHSLPVGLRGVTGEANRSQASELDQHSLFR
jgi:hypothetical protein